MYRRADTGRRGPRELKVIIPSSHEVRVAWQAVAVRGSAKELIPHLHKFSDDFLQAREGTLVRVAVVPAVREMHGDDHKGLTPEDPDYPRASPRREYF